MNPHTVNLRQANIYDSYFLTGIDLAPTGEALALASSMCQIHLWGSPSRVKFTEYGQHTIFPDAVVTDEQMDWVDSLVMHPTTVRPNYNRPLNTVGMPYYRDMLLSAWPDKISEVGGLPPRIDMTQMKRSDIGYYANNKARARPNVVEYTRLEAATNNTIVAPKFLSQKARESNNSNEEAPADALAAMNDLNIVAETHEDIPNIYKYVEIKYSKFGVDDFDFEYGLPA
jgi:PAB-dependent poly(A)-specific ribonuclease subunit 2